MGGIPTVLATAKKHKYVHRVIANVVGLLSNLVLSNVVDIRTKEEVARDDCIDIVVESLKMWPDNRFTLRRGCKYIYNIAEVVGTKRKLRGKGICSILGNVIDTYIDYDDDLYQKANKALDICKAK